MSSCRADLFESLGSLEAAAASLVAPSIGQGAKRTKDYLVFNGLQVVAFATLEDFIRRRSIEVLESLTKPPVLFSQLPDNLQLSLIQEWVKGVSQYIGKRKDLTRLPTLLFEAEILGHAAASATTSPPASDFYFGKSSSNIGSDQILALLISLNLASEQAALELVAKSVNPSAQENPIKTFDRLAGNRHSAAHSFNSDFKLTELNQDIQRGIALVAFAFDTCLSQAASLLRKQIIGNQSVPPFVLSNNCLMHLRFDSINNCYKATLGAASLPSIDKKKFQKKWNDLKDKKGITTETVFVVDAVGRLTDWLQPC